MIVTENLTVTIPTSCYYQIVIVTVTIYDLFRSFLTVTIFQFLWAGNFMDIGTPRKPSKGGLFFTPGIFGQKSLFQSLGSKIMIFGIDFETNLNQKLL